MVYNAVAYSREVEVVKRRKIRLALSKETLLNLITPLDGPLGSCGLSPTGASEPHTCPP